MIYTTALSLEAIVFGVACCVNRLVLGRCRTASSDFFLRRWGKTQMGVLRTLLKISGTPSSVLPRQGEGGGRGG